MLCEHYEFFIRKARNALIKNLPSLREAQDNLMVLLGAPASKEAQEANNCP